jgi:hypothetical protein
MKYLWFTGLMLLLLCGCSSEWQHHHCINVETSQTINS